MSSLGKYFLNLFSATNENNLALASVKFDFSLIKIEAPKEFNAVGTAITIKRREQAEDGPAHRTARRLGALFEQLIPSMPNLISAYGTRVSEIICQPGVNPKGLDEHGPFKDYVGADATGVWAAATSGIPAIAVYMLACMIARLMKSEAAIALWFELVSERKKQICERAAQNYIVSEGTLFSVQQDIMREELALWDNTARSWIRTADQAKMVQIKQLELTIDDLAIPPPTGSNTYTAVIEAWTDTMEGVGNLLQGRPQEAQTSSVPVSLLS